ncbi:MAG: hypothetical protein Q9220_003399 [cf. Caloplaca sp. 1 TL-2023]
MDSSFKGPILTEKSTPSGENAMPDFQTVDSRMERRVLWKCDLHLVPILATLFMFAFLDRINIGNARIQGLEKSLHMKGTDYNVALQVFFVPYILFEVPSNYLLRKVAPSTWISGIMVCWGSLYLISMYYRRHELQRRFTFFYCGGILAGSVSGLLAYALANMDGIGGYSGWRWIFIIEGLATVVMAVISKFIIADWPETAKFLTPEERALVVSRTQQDMDAESKLDHLSWKSLRLILLDWKIWMGGIMYLGCANAGYSGAFFTPTILKQLGWTSVKAQLLSIPIYLVGIVAALVTAFLSDRLRHRYTFAMIGVVINSLGNILLLAQKHVPVAARYAALYCTAAGQYITQPLVMVWLNNNLVGHSQRGIGAAVQIAFGNLAGFAASNIFITKQQPTFPVGFGVSLALTLLTGVGATVFLLGLRGENRKKDDGGRGREWREGGEKRELGDGHPSFRFVY